MPKQSEMDFNNRVQPVLDFRGVDEASPNEDQLQQIEKDFNLLHCRLVEDNNSKVVSLDSPLDHLTDLLRGSFSYGADRHHFNFVFVEPKSPDFVNHLFLSFKRGCNVQMNNDGWSYIMGPDGRIRRRESSNHRYETELSLKELPVISLVEATNMFDFFEDPDIDILYTLKK